jgi:hypothetical protein
MLNQDRGPLQEAGQYFPEIPAEAGPALPVVTDAPNLPALASFKA